MQTGLHFKARAASKGIIPSRLSAASAKIKNIITIKTYSLIWKLKKRLLKVKKGFGMVLMNYMLVGKIIIIFGSGGGEGAGEA